MIAQLICPIIFDQSDTNHIAGLNPPMGQTWDKPVARTKVLKIKIRGQLDATQTSCAYCGLELGGTSAGEIEHIAAKGQARYPEFTYTEQNLVLACNFCNGPKKKFQQETIRTKNVVYGNCDFLIVHPYFHDPDIHYTWVDNAKRIVIQSNSAEATASIKMFGLDSPKMARFRAIELNAYVTENDLVLDQQSEQHLKAALAHR